MERIQPPSSDVINTGLSRLRYSAVPTAEIEIVSDPQPAAEILERRQVNARAELARRPAGDHITINDRRPDEGTVIHYPGLAVADV